LILLSQILLFSLTAYQDFKDRAISWYIPILLFGVGIYVSLISPQTNWLEMFAILSFVVIQLAVLYGFLAVKHKSIKLDLTGDFLGLGDILFFIAIIPFFGLFEYIILFVSGLVFSMVGQRLIMPYIKTPTIPLAGWLSIFYGLYFIVTF